MQKNSLSSAAFVFGILSMILGLMCGMGTIFGGLGITFACLSRIEKMDTKALVGLITSIIGLFISVLLFAASAFLLYHSPELKDMMEKYYDSTFESEYPSEEYTIEDFYYELENYYENGGSN